MSKPTVPHTLPAIQSRFAVWHGAALQSVAHLKMSKFFCGLEVAALAELNDARPGRKCGGDDAENLPFETLVEDAFNVSARTARRYRNFWQQCTQEAPKLADKLNNLWRKFAASKALPAPGECGTLAASQIAAADIMELCALADDMGLSDLFAKPEKEVTETTTATTTGSRKAAREKLLKFWGRDVAAALARKEYMKLPAAVRATMADELAAAAKALKESVKGGAGK